MPVIPSMRHMGWFRERFVSTRMYDDIKYYLILVLIMPQPVLQSSLIYSSSSGKVYNPVGLTILQCLVH